MQVSTEQVWDLFHHALLRFVRSRIDDPMAAEDVLQEIYLKIHRQLATLQAEAQLQAWLFQIARHTVYDYYRRRPTVLLADDLIAELAAPEDAADEADATMLRLALGVRSMLDCLPEKYREALLLTEYEGLTQKELAERLGISLSGAKSRVQRARKLLRAQYLACCHFQFDRAGRVIDYTPRQRSCEACVE